MILVDLGVGLILGIIFLTLVTALAQLPFHKAGRPWAKPGEAFKFDPRWPYVTKAVAHHYGFPKGIPDKAGQLKKE